MLLFCRRFAVLQFLCKPWPALRLTDWLISESIVCLSGWTTRRIWIPDEFRTTVWRMWWRQTSGDGDGLRRRLAHVWEIQRRAAVYSDLNISVASLKSTRRHGVGQAASVIPAEQVRCVYGDPSAWLTWRLRSVQTEVDEVSCRWRLTTPSCSSPGDCMEMNAWTSVSAASTDNLIWMLHKSYL